MQNGSLGTFNFGQTSAAFFVQPVYAAINVTAANEIDYSASSTLQNPLCLFLYLVWNLL